MVPAGVRTLGSAMADAGFAKTRIVLQQWNRNFRPSKMRLDGRIPDLFMVSSMLLHSAQCDRLIKDVCQIEAERRPLIIAGGPRVIHEPWAVFSDDPDKPWSADVAVTGEVYVLLSLLEVLLSFRTGGETLRSAFLRARASGALNEIPGLVYSRHNTDDGPAEELVDTGVQRLLGNLDELPHPVFGYQLLEPPSDKSSLASHALPGHLVGRHCIVSSIVLTAGCKFQCAYCPIPAYNQRKHRVKSGERVADEMRDIANTFGINYFFGTDDNFLNDRQVSLDIAEALDRRIRTGQRPYCKIRWATEATIHDTIRMKEHLPLMREAGLRALWLGVEDISGTLVKKGQSENQTLEAFRLLRSGGIYPVPMMMHHDTQPLVTCQSNRGLLNQLRILRKAGALYTQVLMLAPSPGSKWYEETYTSGLVIEKVNGERVDLYRTDGNYVIASKHGRPWSKQLNLLLAYTYFFNPIRLLGSLVFSKSAVPLADAELRSPEEVLEYSKSKKVRRWLYRKARAHLTDAGVLAFGMYGLFRSYPRMLGWAWRLFWGRIERCSAAPSSRIPIRDPVEGPASHVAAESPFPAHPPDSLRRPSRLDRRKAA